MRRAALLLLLTTSAPAFAQDHAGHTLPAQAAPVQTQPIDDWRMDHGAKQPAQPESEDDHAAMGHGQPGQGEGIPQADPPPEAFEGPAFAADVFLDPAMMAMSRTDVVHKVSGTPTYWIQADRLEYTARDGRDGYLWDAQGYYGGDLDKVWFKSEGEGAWSERPETAEVQALWSHAIGPWFDLQAGVRQDLAGPARTHAVLGVQGLAPYRFEIDAAAFLSDKGDLTARIQGELDQRVTQRLILQPRAEVALSAQDLPRLGIGAGLDEIELGLRLRYEIVREFAPYVGIAQRWRLGDSADFTRASGEDPSTTDFVAGVRVWF